MRGHGTSPRFAPLVPPKWLMSIRGFLSGWTCTDMLHSQCRPIMTSARFDPTGRHVFVGTSAGTVYVFNVRTKGVSELTSASIILEFSETEIWI